MGDQDIPPTPPTASAIVRTNFDLDNERNSFPPLPGSTTATTTSTTNTETMNVAEGRPATADVVKGLETSKGNESPTFVQKTKAVPPQPSTASVIQQQPTPTPTEAKQTLATAA